MTGAPRRPLLARAALALVLLACAGLPLCAGAAAAEVKYTHESLRQYEKQLAGGQIREVTINKKVRSVHVTLNSGQHVLAKYAAHEEPKVKAALEAKGVPVHVLAKAAAYKEAKKAVHHKLRYIAGGILIAVVIVVGAVLLIDRRRRALRD